ncbi:autotransporter domain-containing protein [Variovorax davisae]|uniref:autotransporter domain-containing protein n=1 Tax=Variovorax davisae TaxID=3053515 RepID=UPI0033658E2C
MRQPSGPRVGQTARTRLGYQNEENQLRWYGDVWGTHGWFENTVNGDPLPEARYNSRALTLSGEAGHSMRIVQASEWTIEPQAQLVYINYKENDRRGGDRRRES